MGVVVTAVVVAAAVDSCTGAVPGTGPIPNIVGISEELVEEVEVEDPVDVDPVVEEPVVEDPVVAFGPLLIGVTAWVLAGVTVTRN
jgi:hypothetical protein